MASCNDALQTRDPGFCATEITGVPDRRCPTCVVHLVRDTKADNKKRQGNAAMKITPLSKALGAEITGLDLRQPLDDATVKAIRGAFDQHIFVVFREQALSEDDQVRAAGYFGKVHIRRRPVTTR